jgi:hypothetical protein
MEEIVMDLANCSREDAINALRIHANVVDAVDSLMQVQVKHGGLLHKERTEDQKFFDKVRVITTEITKSIEDSLRPTYGGQHGSEGLTVMPSLPEGTVQQSNCSQEYHPPSPVSEVQIPEIACPSPLKCSSDSQ